MIPITAIDGTFVTSHATLLAAIERRPRHASAIVRDADGVLLARWTPAYRETWARRRGALRPERNPRRPLIAWAALVFGGLARLDERDRKRLMAPRARRAGWWR